MRTNFQIQLQDYQLNAKLTNALAYMNAYRPVEAKTLLQEVQQEEPEYPGLSEAQARLTELEQLQVTYDDAMQKKAAGDLIGALGIFKDLDAKHPGYKDVTLQLKEIQRAYLLTDNIKVGDDLVAQGLWEEAITKYEEVRTFDPTYQQALVEERLFNCDALVASGAPVRLVSTRIAELQPDRSGRVTSLWDRHRNLLVTPMDGSYANVVCGDPADWPPFHTSHVTNALLLTDQNLAHEASQPMLMDAIALYGLAYVPSSSLANIVERVTGYRPIVVPLGTPDARGAFLRLKL